MLRVKKESKEKNFFFYSNKNKFGVYSCSNKSVIWRHQKMLRERHNSRLLDFFCPNWDMCLWHVTLKHLDP